jgi:hypothetical protein
MLMSHAVLTPLRRTDGYRNITTTRRKGSPHKRSNAYNFESQDTRAMVVWLYAARQHVRRALGEQAVCCTYERAEVHCQVALLGMCVSAGGCRWSNRNFNAVLHTTRSCNMSGCPQVDDMQSTGHPDHDGQIGSCEVKMTPTTRFV